MSDFMTVKKSSIKEDNLIIKKKGLVYSILVMFILGTLFLFLMFYISTQSVEDKLFMDFNDALVLNTVVSDLKGDMVLLTPVHIYENNQSLVLENVSSYNYSSYVDFVNGDYSRKLNLPINFIADDSFFTNDFAVFPSKIVILNGTGYKANLHTKYLNFSIISDTFTEGQYNFDVSFYNASGDILFFVNENINISKYQYVIFSNGGNITITNNTIYMNMLYDANDIYLNRSDKVYFGSFLNLSVGNYKYEGRIRYE